MRFLIAGTTASLLIGAALAGAAPAYADDDVFFNHAKGTMSGAAPEASPPSSSTGAPRHYLTEEPRDTEVQASSGDDFLFNHAKGTMSGGALATAPATGGNYVAAYHQYMQIDPRDAKVDANASQDVDGQNPWFNHAKGTMSPN